MQGFERKPVHYRIWDMPPKPEILLEKFPAIINKEKSANGIILDFGPAFPWNTEPRLSRDPYYSEDCIEALAKRIGKENQLWWYIPIQPQIWRGDLPCYDYMNQDLGLGSEIRFLQEQLSDLENLGFTNVRLALDPRGFRKIPEHKGVWQRIMKSGLPVDLVPDSILPQSTGRIFFPELFENHQRLTRMAKDVSKQGCSVLSLFGPLFQGSTRGYSDGHILERNLEKFRSELENLIDRWNGWIVQAGSNLMDSAAEQVADSSLYGVKALGELLESRYLEYQRFRKLFPPL